MPAVKHTQIKELHDRIGEDSFSPDDHWRGRTGFDIAITRSALALAAAPGAESEAGLRIITLSVLGSGEESHEEMRCNMEAQAAARCDAARTLWFDMIEYIMPATAHPDLKALLRKSAHFNALVFVLIDAVRSIMMLLSNHCRTFKDACLIESCATCYEPVVHVCQWGCQCTCIRWQ